eukprot:GGOE01047103.1.p3 GENE.GGOE01047103.1~~GGOE01047103.1.p3  ORF type:complete len:130 (+),score=33.06 GGOE01047103.1:31-390(+)
MNPIEKPQLPRTFSGSDELLEGDPRDFENPSLSSSVYSTDSVTSSVSSTKSVSFGCAKDCKKLVQFYDAKHPAKFIVHAGSRTDGYILPQVPPKPKPLLTRMLTSFACLKLVASKKRRT